MIAVGLLKLTLATLSIIPFLSAELHAELQLIEEVVGEVLGGLFFSEVLQPFISAHLK